MLTATAAICGQGQQHTSWQEWLELTAGVSVVVLGWLGLYSVAVGYPANPNRVLRRAGAALLGLALVCGFATEVAEGVVYRCGPAVGPTTWMLSLLLAGVVALIGSVLTSFVGAGWIAAAAVVDADLALVAALLGQPSVTYRREAVVLLLVHALCTAVASWWARQLRSSPAPLPAKAAEASRILCASWIIVLLLVIAGGSGRLVPDSTLVGLFVATGVGLVLGSGYTRYAEARADPKRRPPDPDLVTWLAEQLKRAVGRSAAWAIRYHEHF